MSRVLIGALVGGIALFAWSYAAWMFLDIHRLDRDPLLSNEDAVIQALAGEERGVYWIPGAKADHDMDSPEHKEWEEKYKRGPRGFLVFDPEGGEPMSAKTMAIGGGINILVALVIALILKGSGVRSFFGRFFMVVGIGIVVALVMDVSNWNWMNYPLDWTRGFVIDHVAGMAIVGFLLAMIVRPGSDAG